MSWTVRSTWFLLPVIVASIGFAATRSSPGDHGDKTDGIAVPPGGPAKPEKKKIQLDQELVTALYRVGLQPDSLAAAGVTAEFTDDVVIGVKTWLAQHPTSLAEADERFFNAISNRDRLVRKVRSGLASPEEIVDCQTAMAEFTAAETQRATALSAAFDAGAAAVSSQRKLVLARAHWNQDAWGLPLQYLVVERTQQDWVHVDEALANERVSLKRGEEPDPDEQTFLATVRADVEVAAAKTSLDTTLGAVTAAWEAAAAAQ